MLFLNWTVCCTIPLRDLCAESPVLHFFISGTGPWNNHGDEARTEQLGHGYSGVYSAFDNPLPIYFESFPPYKLHKVVPEA